MWASSGEPALLVAAAAHCTACQRGREERGCRHSKTATASHRWLTARGICHTVLPLTTNWWWGVVAGVWPHNGQHLQPIYDEKWGHQGPLARACSPPHSTCENGCPACSLPMKSSSSCLNLSRPICITWLSLQLCFWPHILGPFYFYLQIIFSFSPFTQNILYLLYW